MGTVPTSNRALIITNIRSKLLARVTDEQGNTIVEKVLRLRRGCYKCCFCGLKAEGMDFNLLLIFSKMTIVDRKKKPISRVVVP